MVQDILTGLHPIALLGVLVASFMVVRLGWLLLCVLTKITLIAGVLYFAVELLMTPGMDGTVARLRSLLGQQLNTTVHQLAEAPGFVSEQLGRYEVKFVVREKETTKSRNDGLSRF